MAPSECNPRAAQVLLGVTHLIITSNTHPTPPHPNCCGVMITCQLFRGTKTHEKARRDAPVRNHQVYINYTLSYYFKAGPNIPSNTCQWPAFIQEVARIFKEELMKGGLKQAEIIKECFFLIGQEVTRFTNIISQISPDFTPKR